MSVHRAQQEISSAEFVEWVAYYEIEPFGEERADLRSGTIAATIANVNRGRRAAYKPGDFMPEFGREQQTPAEVASSLMATLAKYRTRGDD